MIRRRKQSSSAQAGPARFSPGGFVLCERSSGAVRFRVEADADGSLPVEKMAGLLAVHCLVRGQAPEDYELMVITRESLLGAVAERAQQLLAAGRALGTGVKVSRREREVLDFVLQNLANKEIASRLNVSERTVKFHVSSLLAKFGVTNRTALSREACFGHMQINASGQLIEPDTLFGYPVPQKAAAIEKVEAPRRSNPTPESSRERRAVFPIFPSERFAT